MSISAITSSLQCPWKQCCPTDCRQKALRIAQIALHVLLPLVAVLAAYCLAPAGWIPVVVPIVGIASAVGSWLCLPSASGAIRNATTNRVHPRKVRWGSVKDAISFRDTEAVLRMIKSGLCSKDTDILPYYIKQQWEDRDDPGAWNSKIKIYPSIEVDPSFVTSMVKEGVHPLLPEEVEKLVSENYYFDHIRPPDPAEEKKVLKEKVDAINNAIQAGLALRRNAVTEALAPKFISAVLGLIRSYI